MKYTVGSVPYLNAKPLVRIFEDWGDQSPVKVVYEIPSKLPTLLAENQAQAIMVSSIESLRHPNKRIAEGVCIGSQQEVLSVRIFSKVHPEKIQSIALDRSSMTSNALAKIVLKERHGVDPIAHPMLPNISDMLAEHDACVLIGDNGMREQGEGLHILDLGLEWYHLTDLPFVWAVWLGDEGLTPELATWLALAELAGHTRIEQVTADAPGHTGMSLEQCDYYLKRIMHYPMRERELAGLREFGKLLLEHGLIEEVFTPTIVSPDFSSAANFLKSLA